VKAVQTSKIVLDSIGLRDRPESLIRESQPGRDSRHAQVQVGFRPRNGNNFPVEHPADNHLLACADNGLGIQKPAAARISGRVGFGGRLAVRGFPQGSAR
jgi:hypothetical protein